jgi:hypothetical protein
VHGDALKIESDVLVLKYAQAFYGVDAAAATVLEFPARLKEMTPSPGAAFLLETRGAMQPARVMFVGVVGLERLDYGQIRSFGCLALEHLFDQAPDARRATLTLHGPGYGLDEREAFLALYAGILDGIRSGAASPSLERISIVEVNRHRAERLQAYLESVSPATVPSPPRGDAYGDIGESSMAKPHVFVAMPFSEGEMEDVFGFGIQAPVHDLGFLCERVDMTTFTGDILARVRERIETSRLVIADLTGANPNVYLEVGYAWGRQRPTLLVARQGTELKFDVRGHRCVMYKNITQLSTQLRNDLAELLAV